MSSARFVQGDGDCHSDLGGQEDQRPGQAPPPVHEPQPHPVAEKQSEANERGQPREVPRPRQEEGHSEEVQGDAPAATSPLNGLQNGQGQAVERGQGNREQRGPEVVSAAAEAKRHPERQGPAQAGDAHDEG
jgi:hypothetical protein